jgi:hypothetical protein
VKLARGGADSFDASPDGFGTAGDKIYRTTRTTTDQPSSTTLPSKKEIDSIHYIGPVGVRGAKTETASIFGLT